MFGPERGVEPDSVEVAVEAAGVVEPSLHGVEYRAGGVDTARGEHDAAAERGVEVGRGLPVGVAPPSPTESGSSSPSPSFEPHPASAAATTAVPVTIPRLVVPPPIPLC
jgi:hypothetical protein